MPYLKLVEHKPKSNWRNKKKNYNTSSRKLRQRLYSDKKWIELRHYQRVKAPVCEICGKAFAEHSHHIISPFIFSVRSRAMERPRPVQSGKHSSQIRSEHTIRFNIPRKGISLQAANSFSRSAERENPLSR